MVLLALLAVFRMTAWLATLIGSLVTFLLGAWIWKMPFDDGVRAYLHGSATGVWAVDWITIWGVMLFNTLAFVFNFSGMAGSLAYGFSKIGPWFIIVAPILGWIGVALSGSNTSTNAMFGAFQLAVGKILGFPPLLLPTLNSVGLLPLDPPKPTGNSSEERFSPNSEVWTRISVGRGRRRARGGVPNFGV